MTEPFDHSAGESTPVLVVRVGVNVQPGQEVVINAVPEQADTARAIADEAYRAGASRVSIQYDDPYLQRAAVEARARGAARHLAGAQSRAGARLERQQAGAHQASPATPHPTLMEGLDPTRLAKSTPIDLIQLWSCR